MSATNILVLNAGSATLKYAVYGPVRAAAPAECLTRGQVDLAAGSREASVQRALRECDRALDSFAIAAVGHRIVHGGAKFTAPVSIDDSIVAELDALQPLAPLHQALGLAVVRALQAFLLGKTAEAEALWTTLEALFVWRRNGGRLDGSMGALFTDGVKQKMLAFFQQLIRDAVTK